MSATEPFEPKAGFGPADADGFQTWALPERGRFLDIYGTIRCRVEPDGRARCRVETGRAQSNGLGAIHGGFLLAFVDQALFCGPLMSGRLSLPGAVTLSVSTQFIAPGRAGEPLDALTETVGETGRLLFLRGLMVQGDTIVASFEGTLRKLTAHRPA